MVPIYVKQGTRFAQHGTGTPFRIADRSFLVTAAHVLTEADNYRLPLYIADFAVGTPFELLRGRQILIREPRVDVAIVELPADLTSRLTHRRFLRLADVDFQDHIRDGLFLVIGYPCEWNRPDPASQSVAGRYLGYVTRVYQGPLRASSYDPRFHLLLSARKSSSRPVGGHDTELPDKLSGISGTAIWKTYSERQSPSEWTPDLLKIVAIETTAYGEQHEIIRGTHIAAILRMLRDACPDLCQVLRLYFPRLI